MSSVQLNLLSLFVLVACVLPQANSQRHSIFHKDALYHTTLIVDPSGHGNFTTIQSAIDHVPPNNHQWIRIYVMTGFYNEQIEIPYNKPLIYIQGEGKWKTRVVWGAHESIATSATLISRADNIVIKSIAFTNSYNSPPENNKNPVTPAPAALIMGDKSAFYRCAFMGLQDTLWDVQGRHYFKRCTIQGAVDFIFGSGQSIYEKCVISVAAGGLNGLTGFITAQGRSGPNESNGFIFKGCSVIGSGKAYLGRPWRGYSRVIFFNTSLTDVILPQGWNAWSTVGHEYQLTFAEHECFGAGSNTSQRVGWESKLNGPMLKQFTDLSFVDNEGWINRQAFHMMG